jgi:hypothetical protein
MRKRSVGIGFGALACLCVGLAVAWPGLAQQGHPLTGTWTGDWGPDTIHRNQVTLVMNWDGKTVSGQINPGPDAISIASVLVDVTTWNVRIEADAKDKSGKAEHILAEGHLDDLGSYHRYLTGTWHQGSVTGNFKIVRD